MALLWVYVAVVVLAAVASGLPRIALRGPGAGSMDQVQEEHLRLFRKPRDRGEE